MVWASINSSWKMLSVLRIWGSRGLSDWGEVFVGGWSFAGLTVARESGGGWKIMVSPENRGRKQCTASISRLRQLVVGCPSLPLECGCWCDYSTEDCSCRKLGRWEQWSDLYRGGSLQYNPGIAEGVGVTDDIGVNQGKMLTEGEGWPGGEVIEARSTVARPVRPSTTIRECSGWAKHARSCGERRLRLKERGSS